MPLVCACGVVCAAALAAFVPWQLDVLSGWLVSAATFDVWTWSLIGWRDAAATRTHAREEDNSRDATRLLLTSAAVASLVGVAFAVLKASNESGAAAAILTVAAVATVVLSWLTVHTLYLLRYAHLYYEGSAGGVDFNSDEEPDYLDFAYLAFTVGMTFQVSDTDIKSRPMRRSVLRHALLSYLFGSVIIALMINVVAGFMR